MTDKKDPKIISFLQYFAMACSIIGGFLLAVPHWLTFVFFTIACISWIIFGSYHRHWGLVVAQCYFFVINLIGLARIWLGVWKL